MEYPKIETLYDRDSQTFAVIPGQLRCREFALVSEWLVTEKIDGTNVRVRYCPTATVPVAFYGRTEAAQMPTFLLSVLAETFTAEHLAAAFPSDVSEVWLFGEGYGPRIQKGGVYRRDTVSFRLFDVVVGAWWLNWPDVEDVAAKLGIATVPVLARGVTLDGALSLVEQPSETARVENGANPVTHEGIVCRTDPLLFSRAGGRVMWKLKGRDFRAGRR